MFDINPEKLKNDIGVKRYEHSISVVEKALEINDVLKLNLDLKKLKIAALLHDCSKYNEKSNIEKYKAKYDLDYLNTLSFPVIHSHLGAIVAYEEYNIRDEDILNAIKWHTTGRENMSLLDKVIYLADQIEDTRNYSGVDKVRFLAKKDLDQAIILSLDMTINFLISKKAPIDEQSVKTRNYLLRGIK